MISRLELIVLGEGLLTLALLSTALLAHGGPSPAPVAVLAPQAQVVQPGAVAAKPATPALKAAPAKTPAKAPPATASLSPPPPAISKPPAAPAPPPPVGQPTPPVAVAGGMPEIDADYRRARRQLLAKGFKPTRVAPPECRGPEPSVDACWGALVEFPEIEACSSGAKGSCVGWWLAPNGKVLRIQTSGDTGRIHDRHWASDGEIDELPRGWHP
jgi:hypothetical protein